MAWNEISGESQREDKEEQLPVFWNGELVGTWHVTMSRVVTRSEQEQKTHNAAYTFTSAVGTTVGSATVVANSAQKNLITGAVVERRTLETKSEYEQTDARYEQARAEPEEPAE